MAPCKFFDLPAEIQNSICELALQQYESLEIRRIQFPHRRTLKTTASTLFSDENPALVPAHSAALLRTCKKFHKLATPVFYGINCFSMTASVVAEFIQQVGDSFQHIRILSIMFDCSFVGLKRMMRRLKDAKSLERLVVARGFSGSLTQPKTVVAALLPWVKARCRSSAKGALDQSEVHNTIEILRIVAPGWSMDDRQAAAQNVNMQQFLEMEEHMMYENEADVKNKLTRLLT